MRLGGGGIAAIRPKKALKQIKWLRESEKLINPDKSDLQSQAWRKSKEAPAEIVADKKTSMLSERLHKLTQPSQASDTAILNYYDREWELSFTSKDGDHFRLRNALRVMMKMLRMQKCESNPACRDRAGCLCDIGIFTDRDDDVPFNKAVERLHNHFNTAPFRDGGLWYDWNPYSGIRWAFNLVIAK